MVIKMKTTKLTRDVILIVVILLIPMISHSIPIPLGCATMTPGEGCDDVGSGVEDITDVPSRSFGVVANNSGKLFILNNTNNEVSFFLSNVSGSGGDFKLNKNEGRTYKILPKDSGYGIIKLETGDDRINKSIKTGGRYVIYMTKDEILQISELNNAMSR